MKRFLAIDPGTKRIGLAMSDPTGMLASSLPFLPAQPAGKVIPTLVALIQKNDIGTILVGVPRNMDGSCGPSAKAAQEFIEKLKKSSPQNVEIKGVDERLSTVQASRMLHEAGHDTRAQKGKIDSASAQILLQQFLDSRAPEF